MNNLSFLKEKILKHLKTGRVTCEKTDKVEAIDFQQSIAEFAERFGFLQIKRHLEKEIDKIQAVKILTFILNKDLINGSEIITFVEASSLANDFCNSFSTEAKFFTNAHFSEEADGKIRRLLSFWRLSKNEMAVDAGVFIVEKNSIGCLWIETYNQK